MNLSNSTLEAILGGRGVLFAGSGFSIGARNELGDALETGGMLAKRLAGEVDGLPDGVPLDDIAQTYIDQHGEERLVSLLEMRFGVTEFSEDQAKIARLPWRRIYTTNYDDLFEKATVGTSRPLLPVTASSDLREYRDKSNLCVHLNGFIRGLTPDKLSSDLKLTRSSYLTASLESSPWVTLFRHDLDVAEVVFFVGYSLSYDLDIKRILYGAKHLKDKTFFLLGRDVDELTRLRANAFGRLLEGGVEEFASHLGTSLPASSSRPNSPSFEFIKKYSVPAVLRRVEDQDFLDLLLYGDCRVAHVWSSLQDEHVSYFLERREYTFAEEIFERSKVLVVHADLGNGKTLFVEGFKARYSAAGWEVFELEKKDKGLSLEMDRLFKNKADDRVLLVAETYSRWLDAIEFFGVNAPEGFRLLLSARSLVHDVADEALLERLKVDFVPEIDLNKLGDSGRRWFANALEQYGLLGASAGLPRGHLLRIIERDCGDEIHAILLRLFESPEILRRIEKLTECLRSREARTVVVVVMALAVVELSPAMSNLVDLLGVDVFSGRLLRRGDSLSQLVSVDANRVVARSSVLGEFLLKRILDPKETVEILATLVTRADALSSVSNYYYEICKSICRYKFLQGLLPDKAGSRYAFQFYENVKVLKVNRRNPLFWLQYAIAALGAEEIVRAEKYFDTAYALAREREWYDTYQIDNHYARFLLRQGRDESVHSIAMSALRKAAYIILRQVKKKNRHYPFRVAVEILPFAEAHGPRFTQGEWVYLQRTVREILGRADRLDARVARHHDVRMCQKALASVVEMSP